MTAAPALTAIRPACRADFAFLHGVAGRPENARFIIDEDNAALDAHLAAPDRALVIWERDQAPAGFALFCEIGDPSGRVELRRLALAETGRGLGRTFLRDLVAHGFGALRANRIWLDVAGDNSRAQALYSAGGFTHEGTLRRHWRRPAGDVADLMIFGMLREEWAG
jgi:RimJ/RimL family protein N-acetyltransferase